MIERKRIEEKLQVLQEQRSLLEYYNGINFDDFISDDKIIDYLASLRMLQTALQAAIDIAQHICAARRQKGSEDLKGYFSCLEKLGVIKQDLSSRLQSATGLRNILVHSYTDIDKRRIYDAIQNDLPDLDKFTIAVEEFLKKEEDVKLS